MIIMSLILDIDYVSLAQLKKIGMDLGSGAVSVALETNGRGFIGFLVELPGAYVRAGSETEALSKVSDEAESYLNWLGISQATSRQGIIVERHICQLTVEDADSEILLSADRVPVTEDESQRLAELARQSGKTFFSLYDSSRLRHWVDPARVRKTFYGETPKTIQETFDHVKDTQRYYLSRLGLDVDGGRSFLDIRQSCMERIEELLRTRGNSVIYNVDGEQWTAKKVLRRFIWHDRIHGKAITRMLAKQKRFGLIEDYENLFHFRLRS